MAEAHTSGAERGLGRFEAFTDAVFAIGLTLLIVELKAPGTPDGPPEPDGLTAALAGQWRSYAALGVSFAVIGIYWLQHHYTGRVYAKTDHLFSLINLVFLFGVTFAPFPVRVWAEHLGRGEDERTGTILLACALTVPSVAWMAKWLYAVPGGRLVDERLDPAFLRRLTLQYGASTLVIVAAAALAFVAPRTGLAVSLLVTALYALPPPRPRYIGPEPEPGET
jgi:uncharacterized membrane protein